MSKIFVVGSINVDYVISVEKIPMIGESKNGHGFIINQGGKGANQAIACKKLGCEDVSLIAAVGKDENGKKLIDTISSYGINTSAMYQDEQTNSGACIIVLDESKNDNMLIIDKGANQSIKKEHFEKFLEENAKPGDILITQLEINLESVYFALKKAKDLGLYTILNPAPVTKIEEHYLQYVDLIIPNETETKLFTGIDVVDENSANQAYKWFKEKGIKELIITLGSKGSIYFNDNKIERCSARKVEAVDTTSAGDTFIGAVAYKLSQKEDILSAMKFASIASSITVSRYGAGQSIPTIDEVKEIINEN